MSSSIRFGLPLALAALAGGAHPAFAQVTQDYSTYTVAPFYTNVASFTTTTTAASPTFNRPGITLGTTTQPPYAPSGIGTAVAYAAQGVTLADSGLYQITTTIGSGYAANDAAGSSNLVQLLNTGAFNPADTTYKNTDIVYNSPGSAGGYSASLSAGQYSLVNAGRYNSTDTNPAHNSLGTVTTSIDKFNSGTRMDIVSGFVNGTGRSTETETLTLLGGSPITAFNSIVIAGLDDSAASNLTATLSHNGLSAILFDQPALTSDGMIGSFSAANKYTFSDLGADLPSALDNAVSNGTEPYPLASGAFKSLESLSVFTGADLAGDWTLSITDNSSSGIPVTGSFLGFSFRATSDQPAADPVPEASTWASMGLGCLTLGFLVRRRRAAQAA